MAVLLSTWRWDNDGSDYDYEYKSELILAHAEAPELLAIDARIDHSSVFNSHSDVAPSRAASRRCVQPRTWLPRGGVRTRRFQ